MDACTPQDVTVAQARIWLGSRYDASVWGEVYYHRITRVGRLLVRTVFGPIPGVGLNAFTDVLAIRHLGKTGYTELWEHVYEEPLSCGGLEQAHNAIVDRVARSGTSSRNSDTNAVSLLRGFKPPRT